MTTCELFIGSNNTTHKVERDKLVKVLEQCHPSGFTIVPAMGYWMGQREESVVVTVADEHDSIMATIGKLKYALKQDAIAWRTVAPLEFA